MAGRVRWFLAGIVVAVLALPASAGAEVAATPPPLPISSLTAPPSPARPVTAAHLTRLQAAEDLPSYGISWYENQFHVSADTAMTNLENQVMGQGLQQQLQSSFGNAISDVWFDNNNGNWVIDATSAPTNAAIQAVTGTDNLTTNYSVNRVNFTRSDLTDEVRTLSSQLSGDPGFASVGVNRGTVAVSMLKSSSTADVGRMETAESSVTPASGSTPPVSISRDATSVTEPSVSCSFPYCDTLVGGDFYTANGWGCTMAWYGALTIDGDEQPLMLTAGHCTSDMGGQGATVSTYDGAGTVAFGDINTASYVNGDGDWGYIYVDNPPPTGLDPGLGRPYGGYWNWNIGTTSYLDYYYNSGWPAAGTVVCHEGEGSGHYLGSGTECGTVGTGDETVTYGPEGDQVTVYDMLEIDDTDACSGDSGGPWDLVTAATAVAIHSGAGDSFETFPNGDFCGTVAYATPVSTAIQTYSAYSLTLFGG